MAQTVKPRIVIGPEEMAESVFRFAPATDAEALKLLRQSYPEHSLTARVAALDFLMRRRSFSAIPRQHLN